MKAAVVHGHNDIRLEDVPTPEAAPGEVVLRVQGSGVCATDVKILGGASVPSVLPTILGHEIAGEIVEVGRDVGGFSIGDRVTTYPIAACGQCFYCNQGKHNLCLEERGFGHGIDGGFAEYVRVPKRIVDLGGVLQIGNLPYDLAALVEPVSCCVAAANQCGTSTGQTVTIVGCGPLGLFHTIVSKARGARVIVVDPSPERLSLAVSLGADEAINPDAVSVVDETKRLTGIGADIVIAAVGIPAVIESSFGLVRNGGVFNIFGGTPSGEKLELDPRWLHYGEINLTGTFASSLSDFKQALPFVEKHSDPVSRVISDRCGLEDIVSAVERVKTGQSTKSVILFSN